MKYDIVMPGYLFCDLIFRGLTSLPKYGEELFSETLDISVGGVYNSAVVMKNLDLKLGLMAYLGNDIFSEFIISKLWQIDISDDLIRFYPQPLHSITVVLSFPNDRSFVTYMEETEKTKLFTRDFIENHSVKHLHLPGLKEAFASEDLIDCAHDMGMSISLDCQWHPKLMKDPHIWNILKSVDIFLPNEKEALFLTEKKCVYEALDLLREKVDAVVIKMGKNGAIGDRGMERVEVAALNIDPIDTTGAGDSFNAGFLFGFIKELSFIECIAYGNICGGHTIGVVGGGAEAINIELITNELKKIL